MYASAKARLRAARCRFAVRVRTIRDDLLAAHLMAGRKIAAVEVADAHLRQPILEPRTVSECILGPAHAAARANVAEGIHFRSPQRRKEAFRVPTVDADSDEFKRHCLALLFGSAFGR